VGLHHLNPITEDEGTVYYVDDSWMINLKNGETTREAYVADKDEYFTNKSKLADFKPPAAESILLIEVKGDSFNVFVDDKQISKGTFKDKEIGGDNVYVCVDFDATDGDTIQAFGYDELPANEPDYKPVAPAATPAAGGKSPAKPAAKPAPAPAKPASPKKK